ncbi:MAG: CPBP family glutamic-type intramembrane protease [Candidatus Eiseniibacteriota bacterium]
MSDPPDRLLILRLAPFVPYLTIPVGLYLLESAWAAILLYHAGMLAVLATARARNAWTALRLGWSPTWGLGALAVSAALGPAFLFLQSTLGLGGEVLAQALARFGLAGPSWFAFVLYYSTVHPVIEEAYWRGFLAPAVRRPGLTDCAFAGYHGLVLALFVPWIAVVLAVLGLCVVAMGWRRLARQLGGLAVPLASHAVADLSFMLALALALSRSRS